MSTTMERRLGKLYLDLERLNTAIRKWPPGTPRSLVDWVAGSAIPYIPDPRVPPDDRALLGYVVGQLETLAATLQISDSEVILRAYHAGGAAEAQSAADEAATAQRAAAAAAAAATRPAQAAADPWVAAVRRRIIHAFERAHAPMTGEELRLKVRQARHHMTSAIIDLEAAGKISRDGERWALVIGARN